MNNPTALTEAHLPAVAALERLCFAEPWSESALKLLCHKTGLGVVIPPEEGEDTARAYGGMTVVLDEGSITNIAVRPDLRRLGLGRAVVTALLERAKATGVTDVYLEVRVSNEPAIALYRSLGFETVGTRKNFYKLPTEDAYVMKWHASESTNEK
ncbi:MAG: ribosomal protein S18-alanine N-acetyltransferase [Clostridia bacterium]|nr:ribosomal protein S18-alanine N-acetyltransferase [Clostridia bacterium]